LAFKSESVSGCKLSKEKLTCLICASMAGEKVPLFVSGKYAKLWAFKDAGSLPVEYRVNLNAWMTSISCDRWLLEFGKQIRAEKHNITLIWDNCATHFVNTADLKNVSVYFLPPNTTFKTQLMDAGVIKNLKLLSHSQLVQPAISCS
jgi:hypothetical protein